MRAGFVAVFLAVFLLGAPFAGRVVAQERPRPALELAGGLIGFTDASESLVGGAGRFYLLPRVSVGPELSYISGQNHSHFVLTGNLTFDFLRPVNGQPPRLTPFVTVGSGLFQTHEQFFNRSFTSTEGAFTAGGGLRARIGERATLGVDARVGWELHFRVAGVVGVRLGR